MTLEEAVLCEHHACRCLAAAKLAAQGLILRALEAHADRVRCVEGQEWR